MKKLAFALVCLASVAFFASCDPVVTNPEPTIAVMSAENYITGTVEQPTIIDLTDENAINLKYGFHVESNAQTKKQLSSLKISFEVTDSEGTDVYDTIIDLTGMTTYDFSEFLFDQESRSILLEATITAVVTDVNNETNTATIAFKLDMPAQPLIGKTIEWVRKGNNLMGNTETEMANYGLQWTGSYKDIMATLRPLAGATMYLCPGDDYDEIETDLDKLTYFSNLLESTNEPIDKYRNITTNNSANYNDMLAITVGENMYLVHITRAEIATGDYGTQITIKGEVK